MSFLIHQRLAVIAILVILVLHSGQVLAQEPSPLEIGINPQTEFATAGQSFTYTVTITNVSQSSLKNIIVGVPVPEGSTLIDTYFDNPDWLVGGAQQGETGDVIWLTQEPVAPTEKMTFEMVVNVLSSLGDQLVIKDYAVILMDNQEVLASGPPIAVEVVAPSTPLPPPSPTAIATPVAPTLTATSSPTAIAAIDSNSPTEEGAVTPIARQEQNPTDVPASSGTQGETTETDSPQLIGVFVIIGLIILVLVILGLVRLLKHT